MIFTGKIKTEEAGAIQFEVKNYGTKTSEKWTFDVKLPDGSTYTSKKQAPLKPNERAVLTIGFLSDDDTSHTFVVTLDEDTDRNARNDRFSKVVSFYR